MNKRETGYIPTPPNRLFAGTKYARPRNYGHDVDTTKLILLTNMPQPFDQGPLPACVGNALVAGAMALQPDVPMLSRYWPWQMANQACGTSNSGVPVDVACSVSLNGIPLEEEVPYDESDPFIKCLDDVTTKVDEILAHRLITGDVYLGTIQALEEGHPVLLGLGMDEDVFYDAANTGGVIGARGEKQDFWHLMVAYGYIPDYGILVRGSWMHWLAGVHPQWAPMIDSDVLFTPKGFRECGYEYRELFPELSVMEPAVPTTDAHLTTSLWVNRGGMYDQQVLYEQDISVDSDAWISTAIISPDGTHQDSRWVPVPNQS